MHSELSLERLGWSAFYSQQLSLDDLSAGYPARVSNVQRSLITVLCERGALNVVVPPRLASADAALAVGDWLLIEHEAPRVLRILERRSLVSRMAAGIEQRMQVIAANLDTLFVLTSCNEDFNLSRLERYFAVAKHAQVTTVVVLTKTDLCADTETFVAQARSIARDIAVLALNATAQSETAALAPWLGRGQTIAFIGSSGVGKSTLVNALLAGDVQATSAIREHDAKGRHTTSSRQLFALPSGAWVIDTPGMRELKPTGEEDLGEGGFADIEALAEQCKFRDCSHQREPGCAVRAAIERGELDEERFLNYLKLRDEVAAAADKLAARLTQKSGARIQVKALNKRLDEKYGKH